MILCDTEISSFIFEIKIWLIILYLFELAYRKRFNFSKLRLSINFDFINSVERSCVNNCKIIFGFFMSIEFL